MPDPVQLRALHPGSRFRAAEGYLAFGGSSDAGVLTVADSYDQPHAGNRVRTTDGRDLHPAMLVIPEDDEVEAARRRSDAENRRRRDWRASR
jgi:hypothetical protein